MCIGQEKIRSEGVSFATGESPLLQRLQPINAIIGAQSTRGKRAVERQTSTEIKEREGGVTVRVAILLITGLFCSCNHSSVPCNRVVCFCDCELLIVFPG